MKIVCKSFEELSGLEVYKIGKIRSEVFVVEQNCIYLDFDDKDFYGKHLFFMQDDEIVCYCRILDKGISYESVSIGRVLTNSKYRAKGYARKLMKMAIDIVKNEYLENTIMINAESYLLKFYSSLGFVAISDEYLEDNIPHIKMKLTIFKEI